ncbi:unnamed protein product [Brassica oleracea]
MEAMVSEIMKIMEKTGFFQQKHADDFSAMLPVVYGEWVVKDSLWEFVVNNRNGGRMFLVHDDCTHG